MTQREASHYRIVRAISRGPASEVLEAIAVGDGSERRVALKRLLMPSGQNIALGDAFLDEARIANQLRHANIVEVLDFGVKDDRPFLILEYVDGLDLYGLVRMAQKSGEVVPVQVALFITLEVARALAYAHESRDRDKRGTPGSAGIVHRDVNPANILVSWTGQVKLTDFGSARVHEITSRTLVGGAKGSLLYMSPEQINGGIVDARSDLYGLGCVLHRLIAGYSPLERVTNFARWDGECTLDSSIHGELAALIRRATRADPRERFDGARSMAAECERVLSRDTSRDARAVLVEWLEQLHSSELTPREDESPTNKHPPVRASDLEADTWRKDESDADPTRTLMERRFTQDENGESETIVPRGPARRRTRDSSEDWGEEPTVGFDGKPPRRPRSDVIAEPVIQRPFSETPPMGVADDAATVTDPFLNQVLHGYRLSSLIGTGAWARVYRGQHQFLSLECAVKIATTTRENIGARLMREAQQLAKIAHPNLVSVRDCGMTEHGVPFFTMELIEGCTLRDALSEERTFSPERTAGIARQIAAGLAAAHEHGLVHRDLKPANIMLVGGPGEEQVKVLDFGLLRLLEPGLGEVLTGPNQIVGTPAYMAPEQVQGTEVGPAADLYALGVLIYEMLAGEPPFRGGTVIETMHQQVHAQPPPLAPAQGLERIVSQLLAKDPAARIESAVVLIERLAAVVDRAEHVERVEPRIEFLTPVEAEPAVRAEEPLPPMMPRPRSPLILAALLGVMLGAAAITVWWFVR